jgi:hypothetical protein
MRYRGRHTTSNAIFSRPRIDNWPIQQEHGVPSNFSTLKDNLLRRLRQLQSTNSEWERQIRSLEIRLESQTS